MSDGLDSTQLALLAHELRGALTVVRGLNDLLLAGLPPAQQTSALAGIERAVLRANALIESALTGEVLALAASGARVDLAPLVAGIVGEQRAITGREITLEATAAPVIEGDGNALGRVLTNLIDNALKYSLGKQPVEVSVSVEGSSAIIEVADLGPGIPEECAEAVFEPFERLGRDASIPGTGLGLSVVRGVTESHGGTIAALPRDGGGTIMRMTMPLAQSLNDAGS